MEDIIAMVPEYLAIATSVIGTFALIAAATPTTKDDTIVAFISKLIHFLAANFGQAKNSDD